MADLKISQLTDGNPAQSGDEIPVARSGANFKITAGSISALPPTTAGANQVIYVNAAGTSLDGDAGFTFNGTNVTTTGTSSATKLIPTGGTVAGNGVYLPAANTVAISTNGTDAIRADSSQNVFIGNTTTNTNSSKAVVNGTISETVSSVQYLVASQYDVGSAPNQIPLNQYLGTLAFQDAVAVSVGQLRCNTTAGIGYSTGAGSAVTQITSRTTGVTINAACGAITLVSAAGQTAYQTFTVTNSAVAATDTIVVNQKSGTDLNIILVTAVGAGSFNISFATTGGTTTEQPVFNFAVIKAVTA